MTYGVVNADLMTTSDGVSSAGLYGFKNKIINGSMQIDQRNAGASVTPTSTNTYTLDRWSTLLSVASKFSVQQNAGSVTPPAGYSKYLGITSLSAYTVLTGDYFSTVQYIEGYNIADLAWGTASAATVTLSFWVRSSLTGTFGGAIRNGAGTRSYPFTYTISAANTWEQKSITIAGDTSGTWVSDNTAGLGIQFGLGVGATYSGTAGAWAGTLYVSATGATSVVGTSGATFYITGVQLEKGSTATSFDYRPYGTELQLCQRYFEKSQPQGSAVAGGTAEYFFVGSNFRGSSLLMRYLLKWVVTKRAQPTITFYNPRSGGTAGQITTSAADYSATTSANILDCGMEIQGTTNVGGTSGDPAYVNWTSSAEL